MTKVGRERDRDRQIKQKTTEIERMTRRAMDKKAIDSCQTGKRQENTNKEKIQTQIKQKMV